MLKEWLYKQFRPGVVYDAPLWEFFDHAGFPDWFCVRVVASIEVYAVNRWIELAEWFYRMGK